MNKIIFCFLCFISLLGPNILMAKTLHAILVADTLNDITSITLPDLRRWQNELKAITWHSKMALKQKVFVGREFNRDKVTHYLQNLKVHSSDSVVFYFSGHGYRTFQKKTPWPFLNFEMSKPGLDVQWIINIIRAKKPQFALVMSDCCNNFMENGYMGNQMKDIDVNLQLYPPLYSGYAQLFSHAKGCVAISSCKEGEFSYGSQVGGLYTQCFFTSLNREIREKKPNWKNLLQRANGFINRIQNPVCEIYP